MKRAKRQLWTLAAVMIGFALVVGLAAAGFKSQTTRVRVEAAAYTSLGEKNGYELRSYTPSIFAKVLVRGNENTAIYDGFWPLIRYFSGENVKPATPEGGAPASERISMTTPITIEKNADDGNWISFIVPTKYTVDTLPKPNDGNIVIEPRPAYTAAAIRFTGFGGMQQMREHEELLRACLKRDGVEIVGPPLFARYDPPSTLPIFRRNEVLLPIAPTQN